MAIRDKDIRAYLHHNQLAKFRTDKESIVIDELAVSQGEARIDIAVVNGSLHGYEIKSEHDTLTRLTHQQEVYNRTFDYLTLVIASTHLSKAKKIIPTFWGLIEVKNNEGKPVFKQVRTPKKNLKLEGYSLAQLLWKEELIYILELKGEVKGMKSKPKIFLWQKLSELIEINELAYLVRNMLKKRENWRFG